MIPDTGLPFQLVHTEDVAAAIAAAVAGRGASPGIYNLAAPDEITTADLARELGWATVPVPKAAISAVAAAIERAPLTPAIPEWINALRTPVLMDSSKAGRELGIEWRSGGRHAGRDGRGGARARAALSVFSERVREWQSARRVERLRDREIHVYERAGAAPPQLLLHGFPSSSFDWRGAARALHGERAVLALRLPRLRALGQAARPRLQPLLAGRPDRGARRGAVGATPVFVVAHDMGTSVATELMARDLDGRARHRARRRAAVQRQHRARAGQPDAGAAAAALAGWRRCSRGSRTSASSASSSAPLFSAAHPLSDEEAADQWSLICHDGGQHARPPADPLPRRARAATPSAGTARSATGPGPLSSPGGSRTRSPPPPCSTALRELRPGAPVERAARSSATTRSSRIRPRSLPRSGRRADHPPLRRSTKADQISVSVSTAASVVTRGSRPKASSR